MLFPPYLTLIITYTIEDSDFSGNYSAKEESQMEPQGKLLGNLFNTNFIETLQDETRNQSPLLAVLDPPASTKTSAFFNKVLNVLCFE
jgi:hypothetical protein